MKRTRIAIRPQQTAEGIVSLAPMIAALKASRPGAEVGLVADEPSREASFLLPELDFFASEANSVEADEVIDLCTEEAFEGSAESGDWKAYYLAVDSLAEANPYHRIDLLRKVARIDQIDVNFELLPPETVEALPEALQAPNGLRVAICTSSLDRQVIESLLQALSQLTIATEVFLVGTVKDKRVVSSLLPAWDGKLALHDLCGRQTLTANAAVLRSCDIALAGPGLSSLLSSGYGTFTICIDEKPARGPLSYPYGHGHLVIQTATESSLEFVLQGLARDVVEYALSANSGNVPTLDQWQAFADSKIEPFLGKVRLFATQRVEVLLSGAEKTGNGDSFTELYLRPLLFLGSEGYDVIQTFYRLVWEHSINHRSVTTFDLQVLHQSTVPQLCELLKPMEQFYELANFGRTYSRYVKDALVKGDIAKARQESQRLQEVEDLIYSLAGAYPNLLPLSAFHRQRQRLIDNENPIELAEEMATHFASLQSRILSLLDLARTLFHTTFQKESALAGTSLEEGLSDG